MCIFSLGVCSLLQGVCKFSKRGVHSGLWLMNCLSSCRAEKAGGIHERHPQFDCANWGCCFSIFLYLQSQQQQISSRSVRCLWWCTRNCPTTKPLNKWRIKEWQCLILSSSYDYTPCQIGFTCFVKSGLAYLFFFLTIAHMPQAMPQTNSIMAR